MQMMSFGILFDADFVEFDEGDFSRYLMVCHPCLEVKASLKRLKASPAKYFYAPPLFRLHIKRRITSGMSEGLVMSKLERNYKMIDYLNAKNNERIQNGELDLLEYDRAAIESVVHDYAEQQRLENERIKQNNC